MTKRKNIPRRSHKIRKHRVMVFFKILGVGIIIGFFLGMIVEKNIEIKRIQEDKSTVSPINVKNKEKTVPSTSNNGEFEIETAKGDSIIAENFEETSTIEQVFIDNTVLSWREEWKYASYSKIHDEKVTLYYSNNSERKDITIAINAGHGTNEGSKIRTLCHPDGTPKVTGGSTAVGEKTAPAVSSGTTFLDGTEEAVVTLELAKVVKDKLLDEGYDVLMIREKSNCQLDNIARTVFANEYADCHIALHYDSTDYDKGFFYIGVPDVDLYRSMEPVASHWKVHNMLGESLLRGMKQNGIPIYGNGVVDLDLTQTSYSTIPSVDIEVGDRASDYSNDRLSDLSQGILQGVNFYFKNDMQSLIKNE